ncbi:MAG TPA: tetratricopeptide repeat protein, partial [Polyangiaceae bacterium]|nr:tetratricopeptide repeat protein [Polyangiaceae bacterium]
ADQLEDAEATLEELRKQPAGPSADPRIDLFEAGLAVALGDQARQLASAQRSFQRAEPLGMRTLQAEARYREADVLYLQGHAAEARDAYLDASRRYAALHDRGGEALALMQLGQVEGRTASDGESARAHLNTALKIFEEIGHQRNAGQVHIGLGGIYWAGGHLAQAEAEYRRALERFRSAQVQWGIATAQASIAAALGLQGELEAASQTFASLLELNRHLGNQRLEGNTLSNQGDLFLLLGRLRESRAAYEASIELQRKIGARTGVAYAQAGLAELLRLSGDAAAARALLESACPLARSSEEPDLLDSCSLLEMSLALDAGQPERVLAERSLWSQRFASSERPGSQATARSRLALALLAQGKLDEGRREASEARRLTEGSEEVRARAEALLADARVKAASGDREGAALSLRSLLQLAPRAGRPAKYEAELSLVEVLKAQRDPRWKKDARDLAERARQELFSLYAERAGKLLDAP